MTDSRLDRRTLLKNALIGAVALPAVGLIREADAAQTGVPHLEESDSLAKAFSYVHDHNKVDVKVSPQFKKGQKCSNCVQLQGKEGEQWRPCNLFPGKLVNADGWCKVWVIKPGAKV
jgi:hypothetical protein